MDFQGETTRRTDPIPSELKKHFFKDVVAPNLITDYDVLGFDIDNCMVKYKVRELTVMLIRIEL